MAAAFRRHHARGKGLGPALDGTALARARKCLNDRGFTVVEAASDWRLVPGSPLLEPLLLDEAEAALEAGETIARWREQRRAQVAAATLGLTVGHRDLLALPA